MEYDFPYLHLANHSGLKFNNRDLKACNVMPGSKDSKASSSGLIQNCSNGTEEGLDWKGLLSFSPSVVWTLSYFLPILEEGEELAEPPIAVTKNGEAMWKDAVVMQLIGKVLNFRYIYKMVNILWGYEGENRPLVIRKGEHGMKSLYLNLHKVPIWVHLWNAPLELFSQQELSYIACALGLLMYMNKFTTNQERSGFAKMCVLVDATKEMLTKIGVKLRGVKKWPKNQEMGALIMGKDGGVSQVEGNSMLNQSLEVGNVSGSKNQGRVVSIAKFSILVEEENRVDKPTNDATTSASQGVFVVANLITGIKAKVQKEISKRKLGTNKGKDILAEEDMSKDQIEFPVSEVQIQTASPANEDQT
ncbi:hypothetical protein PTKIN_Ptkin02bG0129200 [Pterospermum kingtungense]